MERFNLYTEAFIFISVFSLIVLTPCYFVFLIGRDMFDQMGRFPTRIAAIQMRALLQLIFIEVVVFFCLTAFYRVFAN